MNRPATLIFAIVFSLTAASAMAQTVRKAKPKAKPVVVSKAQLQPKAKPVVVSKAQLQPRAKPVVVSKAQLQPEAAVVALAPLSANNANPSPPVTAVYPVTDYLRGQSLEATNRRLALAAYRQAAEQGHGPSQRRLWQLLKDTPGNESVATVYQKEAWKQGVPGVPKPLSPVRFN